MIVALPWIANWSNVGAIVAVLGAIILPVSEGGLLHGLLHLELFVATVHAVGWLLVLVVPVLDDQGDDGQANAHKDDDEDATNVVDGDTTAAIVIVITGHLLGVLIPPTLLECLQLSLIQQLEDADRRQRTESD